MSGLPFPSPGDHPNPGIEPGSPALQADSLLSEPPIILSKRAEDKISLFPSSYNQGQEENSITTVLFIKKKIDKPKCQIHQEVKGIFPKSECL